MGIIEQYLWSGDPTPAEVVSPSVTLSEGIHTFTLIVVDNEGAQSDPDSVTITIIPAPNRSPVAILEGPDAGTVGETLSFNGLASHDPDGDPLNCTWNFGDGSSPVTGVTVTHAYLTAGDHTVSLTVEDGRGGIDVDQTTVTVVESNAAPSMDVTTEHSIDENQLLTFDVTASDPDGNPLTFDVSGLPTGADYTQTDANTYAFSWTPAYDQAGTYTVTFSVSDPGSLQDSAVVAITVNNVNRPPSIGELPEQILDEGSSHDIQVQAFDPDGEALTITASSLPGFAGFADHGDGTATLSLSPGYEDAGNYTITCSVTDVHSASAEMTIALNVIDVNRPPSLAALDDREVAEGTGLIFEVSGSDPDQDVLTYEISELPSGAVFAVTADPNIHTFSWTPTFEQAGTYPISFTVSDPQGLAATAYITITVTNYNRPPSMAPDGDHSIKENEVLTFTVSGSDPDGDPLTYEASNLPAGAVFDPATLTFSWAPAYDQAGIYVCRFTVMDPGELSDYTDANITVQNVNRGPSLAPIADRSIAETKPLVFKVSGSDPDGDDLTYAASNLPQAALFDPADQTFSWTPPSGFAGSYQVGFMVKDQYLSDSISVRIRVINFEADSSPSLTSVGDQIIDEGQPLAFQVAGDDPNGDELTYQVKGLPAGAVFETTVDPDISNFSWTPGYDQAGQYTVNVTATDPSGLSDAINVDIVVNNVNRPPSFDPLPDRNISETKLLTFEVTGTDPDNDDLIYSVGGLPEGAAFDSLSQVFVWTPTDEQAGSYDVSFQVSDGELTDARDVHITVTDFDVNNSPTLTPVGDQEIDEGQLLTFQVIGNDPNDR